MRSSIWQKRIPTVLGVIAISIGLVISLVTVQQKNIFQGQANPSEEPQQVRITNVSDTSFTVSYITVQKVPGIVSFRDENASEKTALDDRDQNRGALESYHVHHITVKNLTPSTGYHFKITSGAESYTNNGQPYTVTTAPSLEAPSSSIQPVTGTVVLPDGSSPQEGLVYLTSGSSEPISGLVKSDGTYELSLDTIRSKDLLTYAPLDKNSPLTLFILTQNKQSTATLLIHQVNPVATITLSKNYDFVSSATPIARISQDTASTIKSGFPSFSSTSTTPPQPNITIPSKDDEFSDNQPQFKGTGVPNTQVDIEIHSDDRILAHVKTDSKGNWVYRPSKKLSPGKHTISITTRNQSGKLQTITRSFTIFESGVSVNQSATPSATPVIVRTPTPDPLRSITPTFAVLPTISLAPTVVLSSTPIPPTFTPVPPTLTPTPIIVLTATPAPKISPLPPTGSSSVTMLGIGALIMTVVGILLFIFTRGSASGL